MRTIDPVASAPRTRGGCAAAGAALATVAAPDAAAADVVLVRTVALAGAVAVGLAAVVPNRRLMLNGCIEHPDTASGSKPTTMINSRARRPARVRRRPSAGTVGRVRRRGIEIPLISAGVVCRRRCRLSW